MTKKSPKKKSGLQTAARFSGVAIQMGTTIYLGNLLGSWLDKKYSADIYESIFTLAAVFMSMYLVIKQAMTLNK